MAQESAWTRWNLRYLERIAVVALIAGFIVVFLDRAERVDAGLERATVQLVVRDLQSRAMMVSAERRMTGDTRSLDALVGANPVGTLTPSLGNYAGAFDRVDWRQVKPGQWAFDRGRGELVYRVINGDYVDTRLSAPPRIRFRIYPDYRDANGNGRYDPDSEAVSAVRFGPVEDYRWRIEAQ